MDARPSIAHAHSCRLKPIQGLESRHELLQRCGSARSTLRLGERWAQHSIEGCNHRLPVFIAFEVQQRMRLQEVLCDLPFPSHIDSGVWIIAAVRLEGYRDRIRPGGG